MTSDTADLTLFSRRQRHTLLSAKAAKSGMRRIVASTE